MSNTRRRRSRTALDRPLEAIYEEIPRIPGCTGKCAPSCGPIAMTKLEWDRLSAAHGRAPRMKKGSLVCPMLSPTGRCTTYQARPYICRLWGTTKELACPEGCEPERWLSIEECRSILNRIILVGGAEMYGTIPDLSDLWAGINLEGRAERREIVESIRKAVLGTEA